MMRMTWNDSLVGEFSTDSLGLLSDFGFWPTVQDGLCPLHMHHSDTYCSAFHVGS